jgi:cob(I)alamin adenosyltransferase
MDSIKKSTIYTRTGDKGLSGLYNGDRVNKDSMYFECLGDIDELNSNLGLVKAFWKEEIDKSNIKLYNAPGAGALFYKHEKCIDSGKYYEWFVLGKYIHNIQCILMNISTQIATPFKDNLESWVSKVGINTSVISEIEKNIDRLDSILTTLKNFVVPSGNKLIAQIHVCRSITRRCERRYVSIRNSESIIELNEVLKDQLDIPIKYLNRLSDYLFVLSRFIAMTLDIEEDIYFRNFTK